MLKVTIPVGFTERIRRLPLMALGHEGQAVNL